MQLAPQFASRCLDYPFHLRQLVIAIALIATGSISLAEAGVCRSAAPVTEFGDLVNPRPALVLSESQPLVRLAHSGRDVRYIRPRITVKGQRNDTRWTLVIYDPKMRVLQTFDDADFVARRHSWAGRMRHRELFIRLTDLENADDLSVRIDSFLVLPEKSNNTVFYSVQANDPSKAAWRPIYDDGVHVDDRRLGESVGIILIAGHPRPISCTGVAVARNLVLTNWHCAPTFIATSVGVIEARDQFWTADHCRNTLIDFSWDDDSLSQDFSCTEVVAKSEKLDYALLRITPDGRDRAIPTARLRRTRPTKDEELKLIHHPLGDQKQITQRCRFGENIQRSSWRGNEANTEFEHVCDSEAGSSGGPVFDSNGVMIGLHHLGFARDQATCGPIDSVNKAVWIDVIMKDLERTPSTRGIELSFDID